MPALSRTTEVLQRHPHRLPVGAQVALLELVAARSRRRSALRTTSMSLSWWSGWVMSSMTALLQLAAAVAEHPAHRLVDPQEAAERSPASRSTIDMPTGAFSKASRNDSSLAREPLGRAGRCRWRCRPAWRTSPAARAAARPGRRPPSGRSTDRMPTRSPETEYSGANSASSGCQASGSSHDRDVRHPAREVVLLGELVRLVAQGAPGVGPARSPSPRRASGLVLPSRVSLTSGGPATVTTSTVRSSWTRLTTATPKPEPLDHAVHDGAQGRRQVGSGVEPEDQALQRRAARRGSTSVMAVQPPIPRVMPTAGLAVAP